MKDRETRGFSRISGLIHVVRAPLLRVLNANNLNFIIDLSLRVPNMLRFWVLPQILCRYCVIHGSVDGFLSKTSEVGRFAEPLHMAE